jgi:hypothetical protein
VRKRTLIAHNNAILTRRIGDHGERQMTYLSNVSNERPMLRISATIILAFTCAAPFVLLFSGAVGYGLRSLIY